MRLKQHTKGNQGNARRQHLDGIPSQYIFGLIEHGTPFRNRCLHSQP